MQILALKSSGRTKTQSLLGQVQFAHDVAAHLPLCRVNESAEQLGRFGQIVLVHCPHAAVIERPQTGHVLFDGRHGHLLLARLATSVRVKRSQRLDVSAAVGATDDGNEFMTSR